VEEDNFTGENYARITTLQETLDSRSDFGLVNSRCSLPPRHQTGAGRNEQTTIVSFLLYSDKPLPAQELAIPYAPGGVAILAIIPFITCASRFRQTQLGVYYRFEATL